MSSTGIADLIIGIAVLALVVYRQLAVRRVRENYRLVIILAVIGVIQLYSYFSSTATHPGGRVALALVGSLILAAVMGVLRALTVHLWRGDDGQLLRRGTWLTGLLWVVAVAAHLGLDLLVTGGTGDKQGSIGNASIVLYLAVSFGVQQLVLLNRAQRLETGFPVNDPPAPAA